MWPKKKQVKKIRNPKKGNNSGNGRRDPVQAAQEQNREVFDKFMKTVNSVNASFTVQEGQETRKE